MSDFFTFVQAQKQEFDPGIDSTLVLKDLK